MKLIFLIIALSTSVHARWATKVDLPYSLLKEISEVKIKKDGSYQILQTLEFELLMESAKNKFSLYEIPYDESQGKISILEVSIKNGQTSEIVKKEKIIDRNVSKEKGLSSSKIIQVAIPNVQVGSKIYIKYLLEQKAIVPGHFSTHFQIGELQQADESETRVESEIPIYLHKNDPFDVLQAKEKSALSRFTIEVKIREPYNKLAVNESGALNLKKKTFFRISTDKDWNKVGTNFKERFDKILVQPIPKDFEVLITEASKLRTAEAKVNHIVGYITQHYNYIGDWRTIDGAFSPRKLTEISSTKYGDCKDFAALAVALLRKVGLKADVALVLRSPVPYAKYVSYDLPGMDLFNHAIVRLESEGKMYWIDPTNPSSYGLSHRNDISDRPALALDGKNKLEKIPERNEVKNYMEVTKTVIFNNSKSGEIEADLKITGVVGLLLTGIELNKPKEKLDEMFLGMVSHGEQAVVPEITPFNFKGRQYAPINLKFKYSGSDLSFDEEGLTYAKLPNMARPLSSLNLNVENWEGDQYLGEPQVFSRTTYYKGIFADRRPKGCNLSTDWVDIKKTFDFLSDGVRLNEQIEIKQSFIPQDQFKSTDFELLQYEINNCLRDQSIQFTWGKNKHAESEQDIEKRFAKLPKAKRLEERYKFAKDVVDGSIETGLTNADVTYFLRKNIEDDKKHTKSYIFYSDIVLTLGYLNGDNYNKANILDAQKILNEGLLHNPNDQSLSVQYLRTQLFLGEKEAVKNKIPQILSQGEIKDPKTMINLARTYSDLGEKSLALSTISPALKMAKTNDAKERVWFALAVIYKQYNEHQKCVGAYNQVLKANPKNAYSHINVIGCLLNLKEYDQAVRRAKEGLNVTTAGAMKYWAAEAYIRRGNFNLTEKRIDLAEKDFKDSLHLRMKSPAYSGLAKIAIGRKDYDRAVSLILEGSKHYTRDKVEFISGFQDDLFRVSPDHSYKLINHTIDLAHSPHDKLWGYHDLGKMLHQSKKREELYRTLEKGIAVGELILKSGRMDSSILIPLGALYALYGIDADNLDLLGKAKMLLNMAKRLESDHTSINQFMGDIQRVENLINTGKVSAADLNYNMRFKYLAQSQTPMKLQPVPSPGIPAKMPVNSLPTLSGPGTFINKNGR